MMLAYYSPILCAPDCSSPHSPLTHRRSPMPRPIAHLSGLKVTYRGGTHPFLHAMTHPLGLRYISRWDTLPIVLGSTATNALPWTVRIPSIILDQLLSLGVLSNFSRIFLRDFLGSEFLFGSGFLLESGFHLDSGFLLVPDFSWIPDLSAPPRHAPCTVLRLATMRLGC